MSSADLFSFISCLEKCSELNRIKVQVDPHLEAAAIIDRVCKSAAHNRALFFEKIKGSSLPLVANLFGSQKRVAMALGFEAIEALIEKLRSDLLENQDVNSTLATARLLKKDTIEPSPSDRAPCFSIDATDSGLGALPALHCWPGDGGPYLTLGQVYTQHPDGRQRNCGIYRVQVLGKDKALIRCHPGSGGALHLQAWHDRNQAMPIAIALGGPPVMTLVAATSLPEEIDEIAFAEYLIGKTIKMARCRNSDLSVPATSDIVIEGHINPGEEALEGPFGNHTGAYVPSTNAPLLNVDTLYMRENAVYPCTVVGRPPMENVHLAAVSAKLLLRLLQHDKPWVHDVHLPMEGIFHRAAFVALEATERTAREVSQDLWQTALLKNSRLLVLLGPDTNLSQAGQVYWKIVNVTDWKKNVIIENNKLVIDARRSSCNGVVGHDQGTVEKILSRWADYGLE